MNIRILPILFITTLLLSAVSAEDSRGRHGAAAPGGPNPFGGNGFGGNGFGGQGNQFGGGGGFGGGGFPGGGGGGGQSGYKPNPDVAKKSIESGTESRKSIDESVKSLSSGLDKGISSFSSSIKPPEDVTPFVQGASDSYKALLDKAEKESQNPAIGTDVVAQIIEENKAIIERSKQQSKIILEMYTNKMVPKPEGAAVAGGSNSQNIANGINSGALRSNLGSNGLLGQALDASSAKAGGEDQPEARVEGARGFGAQPYNANNNSPTNSFSNSRAFFENLNKPTEADKLEQSVKRRAVVSSVNTDRGAASISESPTSQEEKSNNELKTKPSGIPNILNTVK